MALGQVCPPGTSTQDTQVPGRPGTALAPRLRGAALCLALAAATVPGAAAQTQAAAPTQVPAEAAMPVDIAGGPLGSVLGRFAAAAGITLSFDAGMTAGRTSPGLQGRVTVPEGFARLLAGSGLTWRFVDARTVVLERLAADGAVRLDPVTVEGSAGREGAWGPVRGVVATRSATGSKTDSPLVEIPQTINVVTRAQLEAQGAQNLTEALRYTPGITAGFGDSDSRNDVLQSRGFFVRYNLDGSRLPYGPYSSAMLRVEPYGLERIEALKGPASVLYGQNTPGGLINMVSKRPTETPLHEVVLQSGSHERKQGAFDLSGPADAEGRILYRLTGLARDAGGRVDFGRDERLFLAPSVTLKPGPDTTLTLLTHVQRDDTVSDYMPLPAAGTLYGNPNGRLPTSRFAGEPAHDDYDRTQYSAGYAFEHRFGERLALRQNLQYNHVDIDAKASPGFALDATSRLLSRVASRGEGRAGTLTIDTNGQVKAETGPLAHRLLLGIDYMHLKDRYRFASNLYSRALDLYAPVYGQPIPTLIPRIDAVQTRSQVGLYAQDQVTLDRWVLMLGIRQDWAKADTTNNMAGGSTAGQKDEAFTWRAGLTYLAENGLAPYASYATSFNPVDGTGFSGEPFRPMEGEQAELGVKFQPPGSRSFLQLSGYQLTQTNVTTPDPDPTHVGFSVQTGEARVRGIEFEGKASLGGGLDLIASYAYTESEVTKANPVGATSGLLGKELPMVPRHQLAAWADYTVDSGPLAGLGLGGGVRHLAGGFGDAMNTLSIPSVVLMDAALHYEVGDSLPALDGMSLRLTATNLADRTYASYCQGALQCYYGQGRTVLATLKYRW